jgi:hypothetical protein
LDPVFLTDLLLRGADLVSESGRIDFCGSGQIHISNPNPSPNPERIRRKWWIQTFHLHYESKIACTIMKDRSLEASNNTTATAQ